MIGVLARVDEQAALGCCKYQVKRCIDRLVHRSLGIYIAYIIVTLMDPSHGIRN